VGRGQLGGGLGLGIGLGGLLLVQRLAQELEDVLLLRLGAGVGYWELRIKERAVARHL